MEYTLIRSARRTLAIEVGCDGTVTVRAPKRCSAAAVESFVKSHENWIASHIEKQRRRAEAMPEPTPEEAEELRRLAQEKLPARVAHYSEILGLYPTAVKITGARTRFGSCSAKNSVCFSWRLMRFPEDAIDYVVVHELCHIAHHDHSREFYALVASVMPDYKRREALLRG